MDQNLQALPSTVASHTSIDLSRTEFNGCHTRSSSSKRQFQQAASGIRPLQQNLAAFAKSRKDAGSLSGVAIAEALRAAGVRDLLAVLPDTTGEALVPDADDSRQALTHAELRAFLQKLNLNKHGIHQGVRVGVIVTSGPELAVLLVALLATASVVPINSAASLEEFTADIISTGVDLLITDDCDSQRLAALCVLAEQLTLPLLVLTKNEHLVGTFTLSHAYHLTTSYQDVDVTAHSSLDASVDDCSTAGSSSDEAVHVVIGNVIPGAADNNAAAITKQASVIDVGADLLSAVKSHKLLSSNEDHQTTGFNSLLSSKDLQAPAGTAVPPQGPHQPQFRRSTTSLRVRHHHVGIMGSSLNLQPDSSVVASPGMLHSTGSRSVDRAAMVQPAAAGQSAEHTAASPVSLLAAAGSLNEPQPFAAMKGSIRFGERDGDADDTAEESAALRAGQLTKLRSLHKHTQHSFRERSSGQLLTPSASVPASAGVPLASQGTMKDAAAISAAGSVGAGTAAGGWAEGSLNGLDDVALILQTSGSTGTKKVVPYTLEAVLVGSCAIAASMELTAADLAINMMPLFHAGGIYRNVLAPLLSGGGTCVMPLFDAMQFWQVAQMRGATWYYASPTMHMGILDALPLLEAAPRLSIRLIANAAGPLLPATAEALRSVFKGAVILPGYGMTECMPISAPPAAYQLEKPGSSGQPLGPLLRIGNEQGVELPRGQVGEILVKGTPVFSGYDRNEAATRDAFVGNGWFKTGDLGYQDGEDYLFITGRSKDVINRGGEIISPVEVESAAIQMPGIKAAAAFPVGHDKLQEAVGLAVVLDAEQLQSHQPLLLLPDVVAFLSGMLHPSKWPFVLVFMDDLPKGPTGKVVLTRLAERMHLPEFSDRTPLAERHFQAKAPSPAAPVSSSISAAPAEGVTELLQAQQAAAGGAGGAGGLVAAGNQLQQACVELIAQVVGLPPTEVSADADFFLIGGSSMNASQLAALLRRKFQVSCTGLTVFNYRTPLELADHLLELKPDLHGQGWLNPCGAASAGGGMMDDVGPSAVLDGAGAEAGGGSSGSPKQQDPSTNPLVLLIQALPLVALIPVRRISVWMLFLVFWQQIAVGLVATRGDAGHPRLWALILALIAMRLCKNVAVPWVGIAAKWLIVGRFKAGRYPLWGSYYLRWWMVDKIMKLTGPGVFQFTPGLMRTYLRLLGARVGKGVTVSAGAALGEFDLLTFEDNAIVDGSSYIRPFAADAGQMLLAPISLGSNTCVCVNGVMAPGTSLPAGAAVGPNGCSLEPLMKADDVRRFCACDFPGPPLWLQLLLGAPLLLASSIAATGPVMILLLVVLPAVRTHVQPWNEWQDVVLWLVDPVKIMIYLLAAICYSGICPFVYLGCVILIKRTIIGKFKPGPRGGSSWQLFRHWLMTQLLPTSDLGHTLGPLGAHWTPISWIYRALGAKIGERIFWPGGGLHGVVQYDLLTIGDDVVFGSRSTYMMADAEEAVGITISSGGNVADRCVLLPGAVVGVNACLGTGGVLVKHQVLEPGAVAVGCQNGSAAIITPGNPEAAMAPTLKPWGKAQYLGQTTYWLPPPAVWVLLCWTVNVAASVYIRTKMVVTWIAVYYLLDFNNNASAVSMAHFYGMMVGVYAVVNLTYNAISLGPIVIGSKWLIIGLRKPGAFDWDVHPYCARWNVYIALMAFRGHLLDMLGGSAYVVWFFRGLGCHIGRAVCLYPAGGDPVMNEPELVSIGDGACINYAFVVNHTNTKGSFGLERIVVGPRATLRSFARLMAGGTVEDGAVMLEHTLALPGETVDRGMAWQGWPVRSVVPVAVVKLHEAQQAAASSSSPAQEKQQQQQQQQSMKLTGHQVPAGTQQSLELLPNVGSAQQPSSMRPLSLASPAASLDVTGSARLAGTASTGESFSTGIGHLRLRKSLRLSMSLGTSLQSEELMGHLLHVQQSLTGAGGQMAGSSFGITSCDIQGPAGTLAGCERIPE